MFSDMFVSLLNSEGGIPAVYKQLASNHTHQLVSGEQTGNIKCIMG